MITIVDYGLGNLRSVQKAFERIRVLAKISSSHKDIESASKLILPGVGHFAKGMENLENFGLYEILNKKVLSEKTPILGICLGMQLMTKFSEEGNCKGLGWIDANTKRFNFKNEKNLLKIPHMGWNNLKIRKQDSIYKNITSKEYFYFVHSYYVECLNEDNILATTEYGNEFTSSFQKENMIGVQFHPEKSHDAGLQILKNFAEL